MNRSFNRSVRKRRKLVLHTLRLEMLESRYAPSVTGIFSLGILTVTDPDAGDHTIVIGDDDDNGTADFKVDAGAATDITGADLATPGTITQIVFVNSGITGHATVTITPNAGHLTRFDNIPVSMTAGSVGDSFDASSVASASVTLVGGAGNDTLIGGGGGDSLVGGDGNDNVNAGGGADTVLGGNDNDSILGGGDDDSIYGNDGSDTLLPGLGLDYVNGGAGTDSIVDDSGDGEADTLVGGAGADTIVNYEGDDVVLDANVKLVGQGLNTFLDDLQDVVDSDVFTNAIPLAGDQLTSQFIDTDLQDGVLSTFPTTVSSATDVQNELFALLGPSGANVIVENGGSPSSITVDDIVTTTTTAPDGSQDISFSLKLNHANTLRDNVDFSLGLNGLDFTIDDPGVVQVQLGWDFDLKFGVSDNEGFYVDTATTSLKPHVDLTLPGMSGATGHDGFLSILSATDGKMYDSLTGALSDTDPSEFAGTYTITVVDNPAHKLAATSFDSLATTGHLTSTISRVNLAIDADFGPGALINVELFANFHSEWNFSNANTSASHGAFGDMPTVQFNDISLNAGPLFGDFFGPTVARIQAVTKPFQPILSALQQPIPVISDLAGSPVTFQSLIGSQGFGGASLSLFLNTVSTINSIVVPDAGNVLIPMGSENVTDPRVNPADISGSVSGFDFDITIKRVEHFGNAPSNDNSNLPPGDEPDGPGKAFVGATVSLDDGIHFPIITDPTQAGRLFVGQEANLMTLDLPVLVAGFEYEQAFNVYPGILVRIKGAVGLSADFKFGYDTYGLHSGNDPADGFFIYDTDDATPSGEDIPELEFTASLKAGAGVGLSGPISIFIGIEGGVEGVVDLNLHDPNHDGKMRGTELQDDFENHPECLFDVSGSLDAVLNFTIEVDLDLGFFEITIVDEQFDLLRVTIVSFDWSCDPSPPPLLASAMGGGVLRLNMGPNAGARGGSFTTDGADLYQINHVDAETGDPAGEHVQVSAFGYTQDYYGVSSIVGDAGAGNDNIILKKDLLADVDIAGGIGDDTLSYRGEGHATLDGGAGDDVIRGSELSDSLVGGGDNDRIEGRQGNDTISGGDGDDRIRAGDGDDSIDAGNGDDKIDGDNGADLIMAGAGDDTISWADGQGNDSINAGTSNYGIAGDSLGDQLYLRGSNSADNITLTRGAGSSLNVDVTHDTVASALNVDSFDQIKITGSNGADLISVTDLTGTGVSKMFIDVGVAGTNDGAANTVTVNGTTGDDNGDITAETNTLTGGSWVDVTGFSGDIQIHSSDGSLDTLTANGGNGNDTIHADHGVGIADLIALVLNGQNGSDSLVGAEGHDTVIGEDGNDTLFGHTGDDSLLGGNGNDLLSGRLGDDTLDGATGNDSLLGGGGSDSFIPGDDNDYVEASANSLAVTINGGTGNDTILASLYNDSIVGGDGNDSVFGDTGNDTLDGANGNDTLTSGAGNDVLIGGSGNDILTAGADNDTVNAGDGSDTVDAGNGNDSVAGGNDNDSVLAGDGNDSVDGGNGNDSIDGGTGTAYIVGGTGNDSINVGAGTGPATIDGGTGNDTVLGSSFADSINLGEGDDSVDAGGGNDTIDGGTGSDDTIVGGDGNDSIISGDGDDSILGGNGNDTVDAGIDNDTVDGGNGDDSIVGQDGNDSLVGGAGNDTLIGGNGNDSLIGGTGHNIYDPGDGINYVDASLDEGAVTIAGGSGPDSISGSAFNDSLMGGGGDDSILGNGGNDTINAGTGNDTALGGDGNDMILGGDGNDSLAGGNDNDTIDAGLGNDSADGGDGNDSLFGGNSQDSLAGGAGNDTIDGGNNDGGENGDTIAGGNGGDVLLGGGGSDLVSGDAGNDTINGEDGHDTISGGDGNDSILGGNDHDTLRGNAGNDTMDGGNDNDVLRGDDGNDKMLGGNGDDTMDGGAGNDSLSGGNGNDFLWGGLGNDTLAGDAGNDTLLDVAGKNKLNGGGGKNNLITNPKSGLIRVILPVHFPWIEL